VHSGLAHTAEVTAANVTDVSALPHLLREDDRAVFGDKGDVNNKLKQVVVLGQGGRAGRLHE
jgi:hypothetical protein